MTISGVSDGVEGGGEDDMVVLSQICNADCQYEEEMVVQREWSEKR